MVTEETKQAVDVFAASTGVWLGLRIYESETVQKIVHKK